MSITVRKSKKISVGEERRCWGRPLKKSRCNSCDNKKQNSAAQTDEEFASSRKE